MIYLITCKILSIQILLTTYNPWNSLDTSDITFQFSATFKQKNIKPGQGFPEKIHTLACQISEDLGPLDANEPWKIPMFSWR